MKNDDLEDTWVTPFSTKTLVFAHLVLSFVSDNDKHSSATQSDAILYRNSDSIVDFFAGAHRSGYSYGHGQTCPPTAGHG